MTKKQWFSLGIRDGMPIAIGYFAVAFALGIKAVAAGFSSLAAALLSLLNVTSAGEAAGIALLAAGTTYVELAFTQLVINLRYLLMSCALSQKLSSRTKWYHRLLVGYGVTDEIFGVSTAVSGELSPYYNYGAIAVAVPGWTLGTLFGAVMGNVRPARPRRHRPWRSAVRYVPRRGASPRAQKPCHCRVGGAFRPLLGRPYRPLPCAFPYLVYRGLSHYLFNRGALAWRRPALPRTGRRKGRGCLAWSLICTLPFC